jgi:hypothetical protein
VQTGYKRFLAYIFLMISFSLSLIIVIYLGKGFLHNLSSSDPSLNSYKLYQNREGINILPIYSLQLGIYQDESSAQKEAEEFGKKGIVTYLSRSEVNKLIVDIYIQEKYLNIQKKKLEEKGLSLYIDKSSILNEKQYLAVYERANLHKQLNNLFYKYVQWLKNNEDFWYNYGLEVTYKSESTIHLTQLTKDFLPLESQLIETLKNIRETKLREKVMQLTTATQEYNQSIKSLNLSSEIKDDKGVNLAKGRFLACWDKFQLLYSFLGSEERILTRQSDLIE